MPYFLWILDQVGNTAQDGTCPVDSFVAQSNETPRAQAASVAAGKWMLELEKEKRPGMTARVTVPIRFPLSAYFS